LANPTPQTAVGQQGFPRPTDPLTSENGQLGSGNEFGTPAAVGLITQVWYRFLIALAQLVRTQGPAAIGQTLAASPFTFIAPSSGVLVASSGALALSRDQGTSFQAIGSGTTGGAVNVTYTDQVTVTWTGTAPVVTFFPAAGAT
jgi:hypothetical protein